MGTVAVEHPQQRRDKNVRFESSLKCSKKASKDAVASHYARQRYMGDKELNHVENVANLRVLNGGVAERVVG